MEYFESITIEIQIALANPQQWAMIVNGKHYLNTVRCMSAHQYQYTYNYTQRKD